MQLAKLASLSSHMVRSRPEIVVVPPNIVLKAPVSASRDDITKLLQEWSSGNESAMHRLAPLVHHELRRTARAYLARERDAHSWQPTVLVNEAYLRLVDCQKVTWRDRGHFFRLAAKKMREILVDYARKQRLLKKGAGAQLVPLDEAPAVQAKPENRVDMILLNAALEQLEAIDPRKTQIVELRFFGGLSIEEIAESQGLAVSTVHRDLHLAKAWLYRAIVTGKIDAD
jgi:RNA polymerase sigma factor (TIGR02999 family)